MRRYTSCVDEFVDVTNLKTDLQSLSKAGLPLGCDGNETATVCTNFQIALSPKQNLHSALALSAF